MAAGRDLQKKFDTLKDNKDKAVISSPAELQFWQALAEQAPALLRQRSGEALAVSQNSMRNFAVGGVVIGALLGLANFSKSFSRTTKIATSIGGAAVAAGGLFAHFTQHGYANKMDAAVKQVADEIEKNPQMRAELVNELQKRVDGDNIARGYSSFEEEAEKAIHGYALDKLGVGGGMTMTNFGWKPLAPAQIGAGSWEETVSRGQVSADPQAGQARS
jgi:hypothetical protein